MAHELSAQSLYIAPIKTPRFIAEIGALAQESSFGGAVVRAFGEAGITFAVEGDLPPADNQGLIVAGDHRQGVEPLLAQTLMHTSGRDQSYVLAMPTSFSGRLMQASGADGKSLIIPVIPSGNAAAGKPSLRRPRDMLRRALHPEVFAQSRESLQELNDNALTRAAGHVAAGDAVTIFPTGSLTNASEARWFRGLGEMIRRLPPDAHETTQIVAFRPDDFSKGGLVLALALRELGLPPIHRQEIVLRSVMLGTVKDLCGSLLTEKGDQRAIAQAISDLIRDAYRSHFAA